MKNELAGLALLICGLVVGAQSPANLDVPVVLDAATVADESQPVTQTQNVAPVQSLSDTSPRIATPRTGTRRVLKAFKECTAPGKCRTVWRYVDEPVEVPKESTQPANVSKQPASVNTERSVVTQRSYPAKILRPATTYKSINGRTYRCTNGQCRPVQTRWRWKR